MAKAPSFDPLTDRFRVFAPAILVVGLLLFIVPLIEVSVGVFPYRFTNVMWRFGAVGAVLPPLLN